MRKKAPLFNARRRSILKFTLFGAASFALGKVLGPSLTFFGDDAKVSDFKNFRVVEKNGELAFYDKLGNEILVMEND